MESRGQVAHAHLGLLRRLGLRLVRLALLSEPELLLEVPTLSLGGQDGAPPPLQTHRRNVPAISSEQHAVSRRGWEEDGTS